MSDITARAISAAESMLPDVDPREVKLRALVAEWYAAEREEFYNSGGELCNCARELEEVLNG